MRNTLPGREGTEGGRGGVFQEEGTTWENCTWKMITISPPAYRGHFPHPCSGSPAPGHTEWTRGRYLISKQLVYNSSRALWLATWVEKLRETSQSLFRTLKLGTKDCCASLGNWENEFAWIGVLRQLGLSLGVQSNEGEWVMGEGSKKETRKERPYRGSKVLMIFHPLTLGDPKRRPASSFWNFLRKFPFVLRSLVIVFKFFSFSWI